MNKIQGVRVIQQVEYKGEILCPFSDEENLYIPQIAMMTHGAEPYWLEIPLSLIRGSTGSIDMVVCDDPKNIDNLKKCMKKI